MDDLKCNKILVKFNHYADALQIICYVYLTDDSNLIEAQYSSDVYAREKNNSTASGLFRRINIMHHCQKGCKNNYKYARSYFVIQRQLFRAQTCCRAAVYKTNYTV